MESHRPWLEIAEGHHNIAVVNEGNVIPWLLACVAMVYNGCTTAIEGAVLGTPSVAFQPVRSQRYDDDTPNSMSHRAFDFGALEALLRSILKGELGACDSPDLRRWQARHIAALDGPLASERMVDILAELSTSAHGRPCPHPVAFAEA